ncbi:AAA family ATPase [Acinetobacter pittii]|uniref:AAA family ATPase n=1 Tax=Acinetobacter pittii TaxID=48296 RepID=UPI003A8A39CC
MINYISIENFRCFQQSTFKEFSHVNLIGGLNNSGKSALLESILLLLSPRLETITLLNKYRSELVTKKNTFDKTWDYLFFNANKLESIKLSTLSDRYNHEYCLEIKKSENDQLSNVVFYERLKNSTEENLEKAIKDFELFTQKQNIIHSLDLYITDDQFNNSFLGSFSFTDSGRLTMLEAPTYLFNEVAYRPAKQIITPNQLSKLLDISVDQGYLNEIIESIQIIDKSIIDIRVVENKVLLSRDRISYLPISIFGDAITSTLYMILTLFSLDEGGYLLIDEVENGIHHSKHLNFIRHICNLAFKRNIQIFMTTHSAEFIESFNKYSLEKGSEKFRYLELVRTRKNRIISNLIEPEVLEYKINHSKNFRGE